MASKLSTAWQSISLRAKLTTLSLALIGLLVAVSSYGTISLLKTYLQQSTDTLLNATASTLSHEDPLTLENRLALHEVELPRLPSDYYIGYLTPNGNLMIALVSSTRSKPAVPNLSGFTVAQALETKGRPFEVTSKLAAGGTITWRMVAVPLTEQPGTLVVALPTTSNDALLRQYQAIGTGFGMLLLVFSGLATWLIITGALRPLKNVERTANAVAQGDIHKRIFESNSNTEVARISRAMNTMLNSIEGALDSRNKTLQQMRRFVSDASHELRTPLVSVRGYAELYRMGALKKPEDVAQAMERIESEAVRMSELVESLLTLARLDENAKLETNATDLVALARVAAQDASVADNHRQIRVNSESETLTIQADAGQLRQVFTNLLANACRFSPAGASVEVNLRYENGEAVAEVVDHGEGIPNELRDRVFERFFRADNSRNRETGGSGLGLAIVRTILDQHKAKIAVHETPGGGATFKITFHSK
ncbi:MAG: sensor histidine kinase [Micrococcales bacterium]